MSQTILIEPNSDVKNIFSLNLTAYTNTDVIDRKNAQEALELIRILPSISLIITRSNVASESTAIEIYNYLTKNNLNIPMIVLGPCPQIADKVLTLKDPISWEVLVQHTGKILGIDQNEITKNATPKYIPIDIRYFYEIDHTPCDIFIRIQKSNKEYQFVKRLHEQDSFTFQDIEKYINQGLKSLYIPTDFQKYFITFVTNSITQKLENDMPIVDRLNVNANAYDIVRERIQEVGLNEEIIELSEIGISSMKKAIKENPKLSNLLRHLLSNKIGYAYQKSHLVCVIGNFILSKQKWYEDRHLELFTYASFFSDVTLKTLNQMQINTTEELYESHLSPDERKAVLTHARDAAEIVKTLPEGNEYLELIVTQHQGSEEGVGFPELPSEEIHPIAKVFIVADAFVKTLLSPIGPTNKKDILTLLYTTYTNPSYQKIIQVLEKKIE